MLDMHTLQDLYRLHNDLFDEHTRLHQRCLDIPVLHPDYPVRSAAATQISETMSAVYAEIKRREAEETADV